MNAITKSYFPKAADLKHNWRVIDVDGRPLGRVASEVAQILKGKDKAMYTPNADTGDFVIVVNASKVVVTGQKTREKMYYTHSGYPGGLKETSFDKMLAAHPRRVVEWAVWGMLPKNRIGRVLFRKLKVYAEATHPHAAQAPEASAPTKAGRPGKARVAKKTPTTIATVATPAPVGDASAKPAATPRTRARRAPGATARTRSNEEGSKA